MNTFRYFSNAAANAAFTDQPCQFCSSVKECLEGVYFDSPDIRSVCFECLKRKKASVPIPPYVKKQISQNEPEKTALLMQTPPVPWVQYNDWPVCCDDYMRYIGEWTREDFQKEAADGDGIGLLRMILRGDQLSRTDDFEALWDSIGDDTVVFVFRCLICGKLTAVCQSY